MSISSLAVKRPVGTSLIAIGLFVFGFFSFFSIPVADLPNFSVPVIYVIANQPGSSPKQMASSVTTPLERRLGNISDLTAMHSFTTENSSFILLLFEIGTDVNSSARDVEAALRAARSDMPHTLLADPQYYKASPADSPIMMAALTSDLRSGSSLRNLTETVLKPILGGVKGVGWIEIVGPDKPAIKIELNPYLLFHYGLDLEDVRSALASANANTPKGHIESAHQEYTLLTNDQATVPQQYKDIVVGYRKNRPIHLNSIGRVTSGPQNERKTAWLNGHQSSIAIIRPQPGANVIEVTNKLHKKAAILQESLPHDTQLSIISDRSIPIRSTLQETEKTLVLSVILVVGIILCFLGSWRSTFVPVVTIPVALMATIGVMGLCHFSLNLLSLCGLTIASGFIVDDAIVVTEHISRRLEEGWSRKNAVFVGSNEIQFTILSMSISLIAVFIPILLVGGIAGLVFFEFAMTITIAVIASFFLAITLTPMLCFYYLELPKQEKYKSHSWVTLLPQKMTYHVNNILNISIKHYKTTLHIALHHPILVLLTLPLSVILTVEMIKIMPKAILPAEDISLLQGHLQFDQSTSFTKTSALTYDIAQKIKKDKAIYDVVADTGEDSANESTLFITLKPKPARKEPSEDIAQHLYSVTRNTPGLIASFTNAGDINGSGDMQHLGNYSFAFRSDNENDMPYWIPKIIEALRKTPIFASINSPMIGHGRSIQMRINRDLLARYHLTPQLTGNTIYDLYGQRIVSKIATSRCIYYVTMQAAKDIRKTPASLNNVWISTAGGSPSGAVMSNTIRVKKPQDASAFDPRNNKESQLSFKNVVANKLAGGQSTSNGSAVSTNRETMIPVQDISWPVPTAATLQEHHIDGFISGSIAFDLANNHTLDEAEEAIHKALKELNAPQSLQGEFTGNAKNRNHDIHNAEIAIFVAILVIYLVLGMLYESFTQPITILSTLPSAAIGAVGILYFTNNSFSFLAIIAIFMLIGIVKKNAILMIDLAIKIQREKKLDAQEAIIIACIHRFRPILMTTICAIFSALPMIFAQGYGAEMISPLGLALFGGLIFSQAFTLFTTPTLYVVIDHLVMFIRRKLFFFRNKTNEPSLHDTLESP